MMKKNSYREANRICTIIVGALLMLVSFCCIPVTPTSLTNNNASSSYVDESDTYVVVMDFTISDGGDSKLVGATLTAGTTIEADGRSGVWSNLGYIDASSGDDWNVSADSIYLDSDGDDVYDQGADTLLAGATPADQTHQTGSGVRSSYWTTLKTYNGGADAWEPASDSIIDDVDDNDVYLDQFNAITLKNTGTAVNSEDISTVLLWSEQGDSAGFQSTEDTLISALSWDSSDSWDLSGLTQSIGASGLRFYVTVNISGSPTSGRTVIMQIPAKNDVDSDGSYDAGDEGIFMAGNESLGTITNSNTITIDTVEPNSEVSIPVHNAYYKSGDTIDSNITGTATDALSGVDHVNITVYNSTDGTYWTGTAWQAGVAWLSTTGTTSWYYNSALPTWSSEKSYYVNSTVIDVAGNVESSADSNMFTYDTVDPSAPTYTTAEDQWFTTNPTLDIDFSDGIALQKVEYKIDSGGTYSTIASGISGTAYTTNWQISTSDWNTMSNGTHYLYFRVTDDAGNDYETASNDAGFTFKKDVSDPNTVITVPADASYYNAADTIASNITGTASNGASGVDHVNITVYNSTDGTYWTGTAWQAGVAWLNTNGTTAWYNDSAVPSWTSAKVYIVNATAVDVAGNVESTPDSNSFTYDTADPSGPSMDGENQWFTSNPELDFNFADGIALETIEYKVNSTGTYRVLATGISSDTYAATDWQMNSTLWNSLANGTHYIYFRITDDAGNDYETGSDEAGFTFKKDTELPAAVITLPVTSQYYKSGSAIDSNITGTASDTVSGIDHVNITIYNSTGNMYWSGTAWQAGVAWLNTNGTTAWYNDSAVPTWSNNNVYYVNATAVDTAGNVQTAIDSNSFTYDTTEPSTTIVLPVHNAYYKTGDAIDSNITGTATDTVSGIDHVNITIYNSTGENYWTGSAWQAGVSWIETTGTTSWYYDDSIPTWTSGRVYTVTASATDTAGNIESTDINSFTYDTVDPSAPTFGSEENQWYTSNPTLDIDFSDGIALQTVEYKIDSGGTYRTLATSISGTSYTTNWQMNSADWSGASEGTHYLYFRVTDDAGNDYETASNEAGFTFKKDTADPNSAITVPATGSYYNGDDTIASNITGTASDTTSGVANVNITIYNATDGMYWNGAAWQAGVAWLETNGTTAWYNDSAVPTWVSGKLYYVNATATDTAGNIEGSPDSESFTYDTVDPNSVITSPANNAQLETLTSITGTSSDALSGINRVNITLYNSTDGTYWTGAAWQSGVAWLTTTGTTSWTRSSLPTFVDGKTYIVNSTAVDGAGNVESSADSNTFTMDDTIPSVTAVTIYDATGSSLLLVKDGDSVRVNATITDAGLSDDDTEYLKANLSDFGLGTAVEATAYVGNIAWWNVTVSDCDPDDGTITVSINASDTAGNYNNTESDTITSDNTAPTITYAVLDADNDGTTNTYVDVFFNEAMNTGTFAAGDFEIDNALVDVESVQSSTTTSVTLKLDGLLPTGDSPKVYMNGSITDTVGNAMATASNTTIWTYRIVLQEGWNLVSIPGYVSNVPIATLLTDIADNVNTTFAYDPDAGWSSWSPSGGGSLTVLHPGLGYWFKMDAADVLTGNYNLTYTSGGSAPSPPSQMLSGPGWNLIGQYRPYNQTSNTNGALASLNSVLSATGEILYKYTTSGGFINIYDNANYDMEPGEGYWLWISDETDTAGYAPN